MGLVIGAALSAQRSSICISECT